MKRNHSVNIPADTAVSVAGLPDISLFSKYNKHMLTLHLMPNRLKSRINAFLRRFPRMPNEVMLEVTHRCNLNCRFCFNKLYVPQREQSRELDTANIKHVIDKIRKAGVPIVRFTGGEPLLRNDIFELMDYAYNKGLRVWLNTNATLVTRQTARRIAGYAENVLIPLNADNRKSERDVTGEDSFKAKLKGIILLRESGVRWLRCGTVATKDNIARLEKIYDLVRRLSVSDWELFRVIPLSRQDMLTDNEDIALLVEKLLKINKASSKNYKIANALPFCAYEPEKVRKVALGGFADDGHTRFAVDAAGQAKPMYYLRENIGNVLEDDILSIWNNGFMKRMRRLHYAPYTCRRCKYLDDCKGGSRIASNIINGRYDEADYLARPYYAHKEV